MVASTSRGYPYMQGPDVPDLGYATQALAEAINADMISQVARIGALEATPQGQVRGSGQNIARNTYARYSSWGAEPIGRRGGVTYAAPALVVPKAGIYRISGLLGIGLTAAGVIGIRFAVDGASDYNLETVGYGAPGQMRFRATTLVSLAAGAVIAMDVYQNCQTSATVDVALLDVEWVQA